MSGYVCYDTQMIVARYEMGDRDFIYHSLDLFVDFISILRKLIILLTKKEDNDKRRRRWIILKKLIIILWKKILLF